MFSPGYNRDAAYRSRLGGSRDTPHREAGGIRMARWRRAWTRV